MREEEQDIRERDELASRIKERDRKNKRHIASKSEKSAEFEAAKRLKLADAASSSDHDVLMKKLREESRRKYIPKRKEDKIYELKRQLEEDEVYFPEAELTERERYERQRLRQVVQAAEKYDQAGSILTTQRYAICNLSKTNPLIFRYNMPGEQSAIVETIVEDKELPGGDGRRWEDERLHTAIFKVGAKDAKVCLQQLSSTNNSCF